jgi:hypothetical protein
MRMCCLSHREKEAIVLNRTGCHHVVVLFLGVFFWVAVGNAPAVYGQEPFIDSASRPRPVKAPAVQRPTPRGVGIPGLFHPGNRLENPPLDVEKLKTEDAARARFGPLRIGIVQEFETKSESSGQWTELPEGGRLWTMAFHAPGALGIRLRVQPWSPPAGAELIIYDGHNPSYSLGPFTRSVQKMSNQFWTPMIYSDEVRVEYYLPSWVDHAASGSQITVDGLSNQYRSLPGIGEQMEAEPVELSCHLDVTCYSAWANEAESVGALTYISNPQAGQFFCSGSLLNRVPQDWTPFFQTARHCGVDTQTEADSVLITWNYQTSACNGTPPSPVNLPQTSGAVLLVDDAQADYTLIGLESNVAVDFFLGWDPNYWDNGSEATGIHHPGGTHKRITFGTKNWDIGDSCISGVTPAWGVYIPDGSGEIEPGSSGSPVFDAAHRVRGVASCASWSCSSDDGVDYGRLYDVWPRVEPYLYRDAEAEWNAYVDNNYGGTEWGTAAQPLRTILKGVYAVRNGYHVYIDAGTYNERFTIDKAMTLHSMNGAVVIGQ